MIRIRTADGGLDIAPDLGITIEYNSPLFGSVGDLTKDYTYPAQLRTSPNNSLLLQFAQRPEVRSWPTDLVTITYNDMPLLSGRLDLIRATDTTLEVSIRKAGAVPFLSQPINPVNNVFFPILAEFPEVQVTWTGHLTKLNHGSPPIANTYPFPYVYSVITNILQEWGWTVQFDWDPILNTLLIFCNRIYVLDGLGIPIQTDYILPEWTHEEFLDAFASVFDLSYTFLPTQKRMIVQQASAVIADRTNSAKYEVEPSYEKDLYSKRNLRYVYDDPNPILGDQLSVSDLEAARELYKTYLPLNTTEQRAKVLFLPESGSPLRPYYGGPLPDRNSPLMLMFYDAVAGTASYIAPGGVVDMRWESLVPYFWQGRANATANASQVKRTLLLDANELNQFDIRRKVYHQGVLYQPQRVRVNIPTREVTRFRAEALMLVV